MNGHPLPTARERRNCECAKCGSHIPTRDEHFAELFDAPFNLAGELVDNSVTTEGEARVRALAQAEARKAQLALPTFEQSCAQASREAFSSGVNEDGSRADKV